MNRKCLKLGGPAPNWGLDRQVPLKDKNMRKTIFANGEYYHIYNRGVDKREVFLNDDDYIRFIKSIKEYNDTKAYGRFQNRGSTSGSFEVEALIELVAYCLNPNHYHFILKQLEEGGVSKFMQKLSTSYTMYFNKKYDRSGALFQGRFKSIHIDTNEYLLHLSVYVNKNNFIHRYDSEGDWQYSSYLDYIGKRDGKLCNKEVILGQFKNNQGSTSGSFEVEPFDNYWDFMQKTALYFKDKKEMEKYLLE